MRHGKKGFTLSELLVVIAIIAIVAVITFPVMSGAMSSVKRASCASNFHQTLLATQLYLNDYDDRFMLVNYKVDPQPGEVDRTWVQLVLPYLQEFDVFRCPADFRNREKVDATFDIDFVPGDTYARYYRASRLSNIGYNYLYLSPIVRVDGQWSIQPRSISEVVDPASMLLFVDTISPDNRSAVPAGGGSYIVIPPCRLGSQGDDTFQLNIQRVYSPNPGWVSDSKSRERYGRAWPWHIDRANVARVAGGIKGLTMSQLTSGCRVGTTWNDSRVGDPNSYPWDLR